MRTSWAKELFAHNKEMTETENNLVVILLVVIPAKAGIHLDLAVVVAFNLAAKVKMDPSVRWDDGEGSVCWDEGVEE
jgi:hypothetical protein